MPTEQQLIEALRKADAAGDTAAAQRFAELIKQGRAGAEQQAAPANPAGSEGFLSPLASLVQGAGQVVPGARQLAAAAEAAIPGVRPEATFSERYQGARRENQAVAEQNPTMAAVGKGAGVAAQVAASGGAALLKNPMEAARAIRTLVASGPATLRAVLSNPAALAAAMARGGATGAAVGVGTGDADLALAQGRPGAALRQAASDAVVPAALGAATGGLAFGAQDRAARALAAEQTRRAPIERNIATEAAAPRVQAANQAASAKYRADHAAAKTANQEIARKHTEAVAAAREAAKQRTAMLRRAAAARANEPTTARSLETLGLDSARGRGMLGGPLQAAERAPQLANTRIPELGVSYGELAVAHQGDPLKHAQVIRELRQTVGSRIGAVREALAGRNIKAGVPTAPILQRLEQTLTRGENTRQSVQDAVAAVRSKLDDVTRPTAGVQILGPNGQPIRPAGGDKLTAPQLRKFIEDLEDAIGFKPTGAGQTLQQTLGDRADQVLLAARDAAVQAEKQLVATYEPTRLAQYLDDVDRYRTLKIVEHGAETKLARPEGKSIRRPSADKVEPVRPVLPARPAAVPMPTKPTLAPVPKVTREDRMAENAVRRARGPSPLVAAGARAIGGALGGSAGSAVGGFAGGAAGAAGGSYLGGAVINRFLHKVRPTRGEFLQASDKVIQALQRYAPAIEAAERAGPTAAVAIHRALIAQDPDYADAFANEKGRRAAPQDWDSFTTAWRSGALR